MGNKKAILTFAIFDGVMITSVAGMLVYQSTTTFQIVVSFALVFYCMRYHIAALNRFNSEMLFARFCAKVITKFKEAYRIPEWHVKRMLNEVDEDLRVSK